jgi:hypothetical protein
MHFNTTLQCAPKSHKWPCSSYPAKITQVLFILPRVCLIPHVEFLSQRGAFAFLTSKSQTFIRGIYRLQILAVIIQLGLELRMF